MKIIAKIAIAVGIVLAILALIGFLYGALFDLPLPSFSWLLHDCSVIAFVGFSLVIAFGLPFFIYEVFFDSN